MVQKKQTKKTEGETHRERQSPSKKSHSTKESSSSKQKSTTKQPSSSNEQDRSSVASTATKTVESLLGKSDQIGSIFTKGLDLAEAGISLGLNLLNRMGSIAQDNLIDKLTAPFGMSTQEQPPAPNAAQTDVQHEKSTDSSPQQPETESHSMFVSNRLPVLPGHECKISFSINNDSYTTPKKIKLQCEGFFGERTSTQFDGKKFSVRPSVKVIEPMDFEKFSLVGELPSNLPSDLYHGWIVVSSENELRIPVRLVVSESM